VRFTPCAIQVKPGKATETRRTANSQKFPKVWAFSHLGDATCRLTQVTEVSKHGRRAPSESDSRRPPALPAAPADDRTA